MNSGGSETAPTKSKIEGHDLFEMHLLMLSNINFADIWLRHSVRTICLLWPSIAKLQFLKYVNIQEGLIEWSYVNDRVICPNYH